MSLTQALIPDVQPCSPRSESGLPIRCPEALVRFPPRYLIVECVIRQYVPQSSVCIANICSSREQLPLIDTNPEGPTFGSLNRDLVGHLTRSPYLRQPDLLLSRKTTNPLLPLSWIRQPLKGRWR